MATSFYNVGSNASAAQTTGTDSGNSQTSGTTKTASQLTDKQTFLTLLVAQIKNQDPMNPADSTQFVTQLAQFSELEQVMSMGQDLHDIRTVIDPAATSGDQTGNTTQTQN